MRKLILDICDYNKNPVCNIYDNESQIIGQATDVFIKTERNGWKELSFKMPSVIESGEGKVRNHRLDHLVADWKIRVEDDYGVDWFIISQPRIIHNAFSENYEVTAGHISQFLKMKNLGLEFSDSEGNNVGTCLNLLTAILEGTGWEPGDVAMFMEDDNFNVEKERSLNCAARTGAFKMITDLCELFDAKPVFRIDEEGKQKVDILPMNPFCHVIGKHDDGQGNIRLKVGVAIDPEEVIIPEYAKECDILELHYDKNVTSITRTVNTENLVTKLNVQPSVGDTTVQPCSISKGVHDEYTFTTDAIPKGTEVAFKDKNDLVYYFTAKENIPAGELIWSCLDPLSESYVWDGTNAHKVYKKPTVRHESYLTAEPEEVKNWFNYLMSFTYYDKIGLFTPEMLQAAAEFQRSLPEDLEKSNAASEAFAEMSNKLSEIGESNSGFLKLSVASFQKDDGTLTIKIKGTEGTNGVIYRSDYYETRKKYFSWHVADKLKENGDSIDNTGSIIFITANRTLNGNIIPLWVKGYVRSVDDLRESVKDINGEVTIKYKDYNYYENEKDPRIVRTFIDIDEFEYIFGTGSYDDLNVYLFCTNSMTGLLGAQQVADEAAVESLKTSTKDQTEVHKTYFATSLGELTTPESTYNWGYVFYPFDENRLGDLYFYCEGVYGNSVEWSPVIYGETAAPEDKTYFFNTREKKLYKYENRAWVWMETTEEKKLAQNFSKVLYFCLKRDMVYKGLYERYVHSVGQGEKLPIGNYAIATPFQFHYFFSTDKEIDNTIYDDGHGYTHFDFRYDGDNNEYVLTDPLTIIKDAWYEYSFSNEVEITILNQNGDIVRDFFVKGKGSFQSDGVEFDIARIELATGDEYVKPKKTLEVWVDTKNNVVYQEANLKDVVEAQSKSDDTVVFPAANMLDGVKLYKGAIDDETGNETSSDGIFRSANIDLLPNVTYEFSFENEVKVYRYNTNKVFIGKEQSTEFTTGIGEGYVRFTYGSEDLKGCYIRVKDYQNKIFVNNKLYTILTAQPDGVLKGINNLTAMFSETADELYGDYLPALTYAQKIVKDAENALSIELGDLYREGTWKDDSYTQGDEKKLYKDSLSNLRQISRPKTEYDIEFIDPYDSNKNLEYYVNENLKDLPYPDINISYAVHMVDDDININLWAYIDMLNKCYDQPWRTTLSINTDLSTIGQHSFTDVLTYIADVAKETKSNQIIYGRGAYLNADGSFNAEKLNGVINTASTQISGGSSNVYTDEKGNLILESQDGLNAMMLTGSGFLISNGKNSDGDWNWRSAGNGEGLYADALAAGTIDGTWIRARTISAEALMSNAGQVLDIGSNEALLLYATTDGDRPAGAILTPYDPYIGKDSYIVIGASKLNGETWDPAYINVVSGGIINIKSGSGMNIESGGNLNIKANSNLSIESGGLFTVASPNFNIYYKDDVQTVSIKGRIEADDGDIGGFTIGKYRLHSGKDTYVDGVFSSSTYLALDTNPNKNEGTLECPYAIWAGREDPSRAPFSVKKDGTVNASDITITGGSFTIKKTVDGEQKVIFEVDSSGSLTATDGTIGGWTMTGNRLHSGKSIAKSYVALDSGSVTCDYAIWAGDETPESAPFSVKRDGTVSVNDITISGGSLSNWTIGDTQLYYAAGEGTDATYVALDAGTEGCDYAIWAGSKTPASAGFSVTRKGVLNATGAIISGAITATTLSLSDTAQTELGNTFLLKSTYDTFHVEYEGYKSTTDTLKADTNTLKTKTQYIQDAGTITISAFTTDLEKTIVTNAGIALDANGVLQLTADNLVIDSPRFTFGKDGDNEYITITTDNFTITKEGVAQFTVTKTGPAGEGGGTVYVGDGGALRVLVGTSDAFKVGWDGAMTSEGVNSTIAGWTFYGQRTGGNYGMLSSPYISNDNGSGYNTSISYGITGWTLDIDTIYLRKGLTHFGNINVSMSGDIYLGGTISLANDSSMSFGNATLNSSIYDFDLIKKPSQS